jgi:hypothetical protein
MLEKGLDYLHRSIKIRRLILEDIGIIAHSDLISKDGTGTTPQPENRQDYLIIAVDFRFSIDTLY